MIWKEDNLMKVKEEKIEHINFALVAKKHSPMYLMHKYWARKPHNVIAEYIKHYSKEGDIVLDPFCGSGVTVIEALKLDRKAVGIDLDPAAIFITRCSAIPVDLEEMENVFNKIKQEVREKIDNLYKAQCPQCKNEAIAEAVIWEDNAPKEIRYSCMCNKRKRSLWKEIDKKDLELLEKINKKSIPYWYPKNELIWNTRINVHKGDKVPDLFTKRNLLGLSILYNEIEAIKNPDLRKMMKFVFTSALAQASKMIPYQGRFSTGGPSWKVRGFWIPNKHFELNVWNCFEERYRKVLRGKTESTSLIKYYKEAKTFNSLRNHYNIFIKEFNALDLGKLIPENSVDYIFTDPPYWDAVPYLELDYMWNSWLKFKSSFEDEIIISDSHVRNKTPDIYERMMRAAFMEIYKVLKPGKWMTVTFHNTNIKAWNAIISACVLTGFDLEKIIYQPPAHVSSKSMLHPYGSAIGDYYIRFKKPKRGKLITEERVSETKYRRVVLESAKRIIAERGEPTPYAYILNGIIVELKNEGVLLSGKQNPDEVMKEFLNKEFILVDVKNHKGKVIGKKWWFKDPKSIPYLEFVPLGDRIETAILNVLHRKVKVSFDDILQEIFIKFPNALTPDTQSIRENLSEYANKTSDGKWIVKPIVRSIETQHSEMIYYLGVLGKKADFDVWIGQKEQGHTYKERKLSELCTRMDPVFRFIPSQNMDRVKQIDVIWYKEDRINYEFEVENTTAITEAIVRGSHIPNEIVKRFIVIPEERETLLYKKVKEPILKENVEKNKWKFITYKDLQGLFTESRRKKKIHVRELEKLGRMPKKKEPSKQLNLINF